MITRTNLSDHIHALYPLQDVLCAVVCWLIGFLLTVVSINTSLYPSCNISSTSQLILWFVHHGLNFYEIRALSRLSVDAFMAGDPLLVFI
jgi:hypothetical protein